MLIVDQNVPMFGKYFYQNTHELYKSAITDSLHMEYVSVFERFNKH